VSGVVGGNAVDSFALAGLLTVVPDRVEFRTLAIPEPPSVTLAGIALLVGVGLAFRRPIRSTAL